MRVAYGTFMRNWTITIRAYPWSFFVGSLLTSALFVGVGYLTFTVLAQGQLSPDFTRFAGTGDYLSFLILGALAYRFVVRMMLSVSRSLISERREGTLESLLIAPTSQFAYFAGVSAHALVSVGLETIVLVVLVTPFGLDLSRANAPISLAALAVLVVGVFGVSLVLGAVMLATGDTYISQNTLFHALLLISGFLFPVAYLPQALEWAGRLFPITWGLEAFRAAALQQASSEAVAPGLTIAGAMGLVYALAGLRLVSSAQARALEGPS